MLEHRDIDLAKQYTALKANNLDKFSQEGGSEENSETHTSFCRGYILNRRLKPKCVLFVHAFAAVFCFKYLKL